MFYLFVGEDVLYKDKQIEDIKNKYLKDNNAKLFDYKLLHGHKLSLKELKRGLCSTPVASKKRIVVIRDIDKLTDINKDLLLSFLNESKEHIELILDVKSVDKKKKFFSTLLKKVKLVEFKTAKKKNIFDVTNALKQNNPTLALKTVHELFHQGEHPLKLMGGLIWFWGSIKTRLTEKAFKKGLYLLQDTDLNIKRSRMDPEYAIEFLIIRLLSLIT